MNYRVEWSIDIFDAENPEDAARQARAYQTRPGTMATVFDVYEEDGDGEAIKVDLTEIDEQMDIHVGQPPYDEDTLDDPMNVASVVCPEAVRGSEAWENSL